jgi:uncharacterized protein with ParB-like and HNH nuclease domain
LIYTAEEENVHEVVIDGQQRLTTCFAFIQVSSLFQNLMKTNWRRANPLIGSHLSSEK